MKTAISIRDEVFEAAERTARDLGMSRSELYATAVKEFVARHRSLCVTERLDAVYGKDGARSSLDEVLGEMQRLSLGDESW